MHSPYDERYAWVLLLSGTSVVVSVGVAIHEWMYAHDHPHRYGPAYVIVLLALAVAALGLALTLFLHAHFKAHSAIDTRLEAHEDTLDSYGRIHILQLENVVGELVDRRIAEKTDSNPEDPDSH